MSPITRTVSLAAVLLAALPLFGFRATAAWAQAPTLPSDTLEANFAPPSALAPSPELAPSLPSDTIWIGAPLEGYDSTVTDSLNPGPARDDATSDQGSRPPY
jgi:hypothetical protein